MPDLLFILSSSFFLLHSLFFIVGMKESVGSEDRETVGAIHESPAVGAADNAPHQSLPLMRELAPQATEGEKTFGLY